MCRNSYESHEMTSLKSKIFSNISKTKLYLLIFCKNVK